jgi:hypothetical protein
MLPPLLLSERTEQQSEKVHGCVLIYAWVAFLCSTVVGSEGAKLSLLEQTS